MTVKKILFAVTLIATVNACTKQVNNVDIKGGETTAVIPLAKKWDNTVENVAKDVATKLKSIHFRRMLRHEVCLRFDGDANILVSSMLNRLPKYLEYEKNNLLSSRDPNEQEMLAGFNFAVLQQAAIDFPQIQIAMQTHAEDWDAFTYVPKVVYLPAAFD
jgi:hypothetical protein